LKAGGSTLVSRLSSGGIITNYNCTAACGHCLYKSSPQRDRAYITTEMIASLVRKASSLGCGSFHIGGGEPFLDPEGLQRTIRTIREEGASVEYLETNAFWFKDQVSARELLSKIRAAGCHTLMVSVCPFHVEFVPLAKAQGAVRACRELGMDYFIWQDQYIDELSRLDPDTTHSPAELKELFGEDYILRAGRRFGLRINGRALETLKPHLRRHPAEFILAAEPGPCRELRVTSHFHLDLYGNYVPPGCVGLVMDHRFLGLDIPEEYRHLRILDLKGIGGLFRYAREERGFEPDPGGYVSKCDLCLSIRKHLVLCCGGSAANPDLGPEEFYRMG
jgi:hypothetical protein